MTIAEYRAKNKKKTIADYKASQRKLASTPFAKRESMGLSAAIDRDAAQTANEALRQRMIEREAERLAKIETEKIAQAAVIAKQKLSQEDEMRKAALPTGIKFEPNRITSDRIPKISDINRSAANVDYSREIQSAEESYKANNPVETPLQGLKRKAQKYNPLAIADMMINKAGAGIAQSAAAIGDSAIASVKARGDNAVTEYVDNARKLLRQMFTGKRGYAGSQENAQENWDVDKKTKYYQGETLQDKADRYADKIGRQYIGLTDTFLSKAASEIASSYGYMVPAMLANTVLAGSGTLVLFASGYAQGERQAVMAGADAEDARNYALLNGLNQSAGELLIGSFLGKSQGVVNSLLKKTGLDLAQLIKNPTLRRNAAKVLAAIGEGAEEMVQKGIDVAAQRTTYNPDATTNVKEVLYEGLLGAGLGALAGAGRAIIRPDAITEADTAAEPVLKLPSVKPTPTPPRLPEIKTDYAEKSEAEVKRVADDLQARFRTADEDIRLNRIQSAADELERTAAVYDVPDEEVKAVSKIAKAGKLDIRYYRGLSRDGLTENGRISNGILWLNADSKQNRPTIIAHELTHHLEGTKTYNTFLKYVMEQSDISTKSDYIKGLYNRAGITLSDPELNHELIANYVESKLLTDETAVFDMVRTNRTLGEKIHQWLSDMVVKLTGTNEEVMLIKSRDLFSRALSEVRQGETSQTQAASVSEDVKSDNFKQWFGDWENSPDTASKTVDKSRKPMVLYHQTANDFTVFDTTAKGAGTSDYETPYGIFLKSSSNDIGLKGKKQMPVYANIRNPLIVADRAELNQKLSDLSPELKAFFDKVKGNDDLYRQKWRKSKDAEHDYIRNWREKNPDGDLTNDQGIKDLFDSTSNLLTEWTESNKSLNGKSKDIVTQTLKDAGYDGVRIAQDKGSFGRATDTYIALNPTQIKSATSNIGTYDSKNPDIRYSISDTAYMDAVERGDTDTAQQMVDEAAKKAGYNIKAYHGTTAKRFNEFTANSYFSPKYEYAERYSKVLQPDGTNEPKVYSVYLKPGNAKKVSFDTVSREAYATLDKAKRDTMLLKQPLFADGTPEYIVKNPSQIKSADPITYDDSGNVIPLSKRFDSAKSDIRYSISEDEAAAPRTTAELESENKQLRELNEYQRKQMNRTSTVEPNIHAVYSYVKRLKKSYDSVTPVKQIADKLSALYVYTANGEGEEHGHDWHYMYEYARDIAKDILSGSKRVIEPETLERYNQLKKHVKGIKFYVSPKDKGDFGDFNAFRVKNMSKFGITTADGEGAVGINNTYSQLTDAFGEDWFPSEIWNQADQLQQLSDMLGGLDKLYKYPYSNKQFEEVAAFVAGDILDAFYDIPQAPPTFADKAEKKLVLEKVKAAHKVERLREEKNSRIENLRVSMREQSMKKINALRENNEKKIAALKEATQKRIAKSAQGRNATDIRRKLKHNCAEMAKKLTNPDKNSHVPDSLRQTVAELLQMIEFSPDEVIQSGDNKGQKKSDVLKAKLRRVSETYRRFIATTDEVKPIADVDMQNMFDEAQDSLSVKSIRQLDAEELANLYKLTKSIYSAIRKENQAFIKGKQDSIDGTAEDVRAENTKKGSRNDPTKWLPKVADKLLNFATMDPRAFFKRLGATMESLYMNIERGQDKYIETVTRTVNFMGDTLKGVDTTKWDGPDAEIITVGVYGDYLKKEIHEVKMTPAMIMELYLLNQREQARKHIYGQAGISLMMPGASKTQPPVIVTEDDVNGIIAKMTPEMKRVADAMGKYVSEDMSVLGNEVSLAMYGYSKFTDPHYWQIHVDKGGVPATYGETQGDPKLANNGFTKALKEVASNPLVIGSALDTFDKHTVQMAAYNAYVLPLSDMERVLNNKDMFGMTVGSMISDKHGAEARKYIDSFMKLVNGAKLSNNLWNDDISSKLLRNFKSAAVGLNLSVLAKQPISYIRAANEVNPKYLTEALKIESRASRQKNMNEMLKYNPIARIKDWGYADMGFGKNQRQLYDKSAMTVSDKVSEVSGYLPSMADKVTWARIWSAVKSEQNAKGIFDLREIAVRFKEVISNTQVVNTIFTTPAILNSDSLLTKMSTAFMGEPLKTYNMLKTALESKNSAKIVRASGVLLANTFAVAVVTTAFSNLRDKDDDDDDIFDISKEVLQNMAYDTAGMIPYFRDLSSLFQGYDIQRTDLAGVGKIFDALRSLKGDIELAANGNAPKGTALLHTKNMVAALSQVLGVPVGNVWRDFESIMMSAAEASGNAAMEYLMTVSMYNPENAQNRKYYYDMLDKYRDDKDVFEKLSKLLKGKYGYTDDQIQNGMRERMKDTEEYKDAFKTVSNDTVPGIESSEYYLQLPKAERDEVMKQAKTYASGIAMAQADKTYKQSAWAQNITDAVASGLTAGEYLLFAAAKRKADAAGNDNGSYSTEEQIAALRDMGWLPVSKQELLYKGMADNADELAARTDKLEALTDAGLNFAEFLNIYQKHGEIGADDTLTASQQALKFANWLDERYTPEQSDIAQEHFGYWSGAKANPSNYNKFADAGIEYDTAYEIAADLMALSPLEGKKSVSNAQQYRLIADSDYDDKIKIQAMSVLMEESAYTNFRKATLKGVSISKYVDFVENSARIESDIEDGKPVSGRHKAKVLTMIDDMFLSDQGKTALYYAAGYAESTIDEAPWNGGERYENYYTKTVDGIVIRKLPKKS